MKLVVLCTDETFQLAIIESNIQLPGADFESHAFDN